MNLLWLSEFLTPSRIQHTVSVAKSLKPMQIRRLFEVLSLFEFAAAASHSLLHALKSA